MPHDNDDDERITHLLAAIERGERDAGAKLLPIVYDELRARAGRLMVRERRDHTLQRTALVHEVFIKLVKPGAGFESRRHFFNAAAMAMRSILKDHASARKALKRGGGVAELSLDDVDHAPASGATASPTIDILDLDDALSKLAAKSPRQAEVVILRFFGGLDYETIAQLQGVNEKTVRRDWATAKLWLYDAMEQGRPNG
jgi:RNA polymerase sigma-70 factor, ECF subfamily